MKKPSRSATARQSRQNANRRKWKGRDQYRREYGRWLAFLKRNRGGGVRRTAEHPILSLPRGSGASLIGAVAAAAGMGGLIAVAGERRERDLDERVMRTLFGPEFNPETGRYDK